MPVNIVYAGPKREGLDDLPKVEHSIDALGEETVSRLLLVLATALIVAGCQADSPPPQTAAPQTAALQASASQPTAPSQPDRTTLVKPGGTAQQYVADRLDCMQSSQQPVTRTTTDANGAPVTTTTQGTNGPVFSACMGVHGYYPRKLPAPGFSPETQAALTARGQDMTNKVCRNPAYAAYFARTACAPGRMTVAQMTDPARISPQEKAVFGEVRRDYETQQDAINEVIRNGSPHGAKVVEIYLATFRPQVEKNDRDLANGAITWGTYNKRRLEIVHAHTVAAQFGD